jgi:hypothetical protein
METCCRGSCGPNAGQAHPIKKFPATFVTNNKIEAGAGEFFGSSSRSNDPGKQIRSVSWKTQQVLPALEKPTKWKEIYLFSQRVPSESRMTGRLG